ncbi:MAG: D-alanine--D-alanine ligase family protein [Nakamurella sp.]
MNSQQRIRVAVVFGGRSGEHSVSCLSAASVLARLDPERFEVAAIGITPDGGWRSVDAAGLREVQAGRFPEVADGPTVSLRMDANSTALVPTGDGTSVTTAEAALGVDVVFPLLHGPMGEDGTLQGLLELTGLPYVGAGVLASAVGMDKEFTKKLLAAEGLPVGSYAVLRPADETLPLAQRQRLGLPVFVKPARAGSSLGVSKVDDWADLDAAVHAARQADPKVLVEAAVVGREIECGVLEHPDGTLQASPTAEIHLAGDHDFYDFDAKYVDDVVTFDIPAKLPDEVTQQIQAMAVTAFRALDGQGLARVDFFVAENGEVVINEVNTMPGFTPISMYPRVFGVAGICYPELLDTLIRTAIARGTGLR